MEDDDWITEDVDDYFLGSEVEEEYVDPEGYSYVDPEPRIRLDGRTFGKNQYLSNHIDRHIDLNPS